MNHETASRRGCVNCERPMCEMYFLTSNIFILYRAVVVSLAFRFSSLAVLYFF